MSERERGCGYRKVGGAYLVGTGLAVPCDALPLELLDCPCCEFTIPFSRNIIKIHGGYLKGRLKGHWPHNCKDTFPCPICQGNKKMERFYVMYVSQEAYTPQSFIKEAREQGVSKRIPPQSIPKDLKFDEDWIMLAMKKYPLNTPEHPDPRFAHDKVIEAKAIFYAFMPQRKEMILWDDSPKAEIDHWTKQGFTIVKIPHTKENEKKHGGD
jgi:hypothetical protein